MYKPVQKIAPFLWFEHQAEEAVRFLYLHFQRFKSRPRWGNLWVVWSTFSLVIE